MFYKYKCIIIDWRTFIRKRKLRVVYNMYYNCETRTTDWHYYEGCFIMLMPDKSYGDNNDNFPYYNKIIYMTVYLYMYKWRDHITHRAKIVTKVVVCHLFIIYYRAMTKEKREKKHYAWNIVINTMYNSCTQIW